MAWFSADGRGIRQLVDLQLVDLQLVDLRVDPLVRSLLSRTVSRVVRITPRFVVLREGKRRSEVVQQSLVECAAAQAQHTAIAAVVAVVARPQAGPDHAQAELGAPPCLPDSFKIGRLSGVFSRLMSTQTGVARR